MGAPPARARAGPKPSLPGANSDARERSAQKTGVRLLALGADLPERMASADHHALATARNCCERYSKRSSSPCLRTNTAPRLTLRWRGGALTDIDLDLPRPNPAIVRTDEDTIALVRRLAAYYPDAIIAGILNRQDRIPLTVIALLPTMSAICGGIGTSRCFEPPAYPP